MSDCIKLSYQRITKYNINQQLLKNWIIFNKNQIKKKIVEGSLNELASALRKLTFILLEIFV